MAAEVFPVYKLEPNALGQLIHKPCSRVIVRVISKNLLPWCIYIYFLHTAFRMIYLTSIHRKRLLRGSYCSLRCLQEKPAKGSEWRKGVTLSTLKGIRVWADFLLKTFVAIVRNAFSFLLVILCFFVLGNICTTWFICITHSKSVDLLFSLQHTKWFHWKLVWLIVVSLHFIIMALLWENWTGLLWLEWMVTWLLALFFSLFSFYYFSCFSIGKHVGLHSRTMAATFMNAN